MNYRFRHVYMDGTPGAAGGGDPAPGAATPPAGGDPAAAGGQPPATPPAGSALSGGSEWTLGSIPEKFHVKNDAGEFDAQAMLRKVDEHRSSLEKRLGSGDARPKTADEYKLPESDAFKALQLDDGLTKAFKDKAHGWGLSQSQYEAVLGEWATLAPGLVNSGKEITTETAVQQLQETWKGDYDTNIKESFRVVSKVADMAGIPMQEVEAAIGNNPVAIRLFQALGKEMKEDATPAGAGGLGGGGVTAEQYMAENWAAYSDPKNPQHAAVSARVKQLAEREAKRMPE